jgi:uncharacterized protein (UPF0218 family)
MLFVNQKRMPPPNLNLKRLKAVARRYNSKLKKPIKLSQKKDDLRNELRARKVSLYSKTEQLKNMVRRENKKATVYDKVKRRANRAKELGTHRHLDNVIDRLEKKHGKKKKKKKFKRLRQNSAGAPKTPLAEPMPALPMPSNTLVARKKKK